MNTVEERVGRITGQEVLAKGVHLSDDGSVHTHWCLLDISTALEGTEGVSGVDAAIRKIKDAIDHEFPPTHCQHSHDCCGKWYQDPVDSRWVPGIGSMPDMMAVRIEWRQNV